MLCCLLQNKNKLLALKCMPTSCIETKDDYKHRANHANALNQIQNIQRRCTLSKLCKLTDNLTMFNFSL